MPAAAGDPDRTDLGWCSVVPPPGFAVLHAAPAAGMTGGSALLAPAPPAGIAQKNLFAETARDFDPAAFPESISLYAGPAALPGPPLDQIRAMFDTLRRSLGPLAVERLAACAVADHPGAAAHLCYHAACAVALLCVVWDHGGLRCAATMHAPARRGAARMGDLLRLAASLVPDRRPADS